MPNESRTEPVAEVHIRAIGTVDRGNNGWPPEAVARVNVCLGNGPDVGRMVTVQIVVFGSEDGELEAVWLEDYFETRPLPIR